VRYFEKEHQLEELLIRERLEKIQTVDRNGSTSAITEAKLQRFSRALKEYEGWAGKLREQYGGQAVSYVKDHRLVEQQIDNLDELVAALGADDADALHRVELLDRADDGVTVKISEKSNGSARTVRLPLALFESSAYRSLRATRERLVDAVGTPPFTLTLGKHTEPVPTFERLRPAILELAKEGLNLQRFKGLGEMNPEQLWETTMNPENRVLQQVSVEDAAAADEVFSMLMGDRVEPRRDFIERNARDVKFLDI
jgi:DNA gyrase subunit B